MNFLKTVWSIVLRTHPAYHPPCPQRGIRIDMEENDLGRVYRATMTTVDDEVVTIWSHAPRFEGQMDADGQRLVQAILDWQDE